MFSFSPVCAGDLLRLAFSCAIQASGAFLLAFAANAQTSTPGKMPGELSVSPSGAATYRVPITVPPGVAGMEPKLALAYSSQAGSGITGMGWSLEGLSVITRCPKTWLTDGVKAGVTHTTEDRFCLDGQRLINVSGAYGEAGSEYRTELESFSKIIANGMAAGSAANGPQSFTVKTKAGLTMEYGATSDSRIEAQGKDVVRLWALSEIRDAKGNPITLTYDEDALGGEFRINTVTYAGRTVQFHYEDRPDIFSGYEVESKIGQSKRLREVETRIGTQPVRHLHVSYAAASSVFGSFAASISSCDNGGSCLEPVTFDYGQLSLGQQANFQASGASTAFHRVHQFAFPHDDRIVHLNGDFNGDGLTDILTYTSPVTNILTYQCGGEECFNVLKRPTYHVSVANGNGAYSQLGAVLNFNAMALTDQSHVGNFDILAGDVNGDGKTDAIGYSMGGGNGIKTAVALGTASGTFAHQSMEAYVGSGYGAGWKMMVADVNGDGRTDLIAYLLNSSGVHLRTLLSNGVGGFALQPQQTAATGNLQGWQLEVASVNGDGHADLVAHYIGTSGIKLLRLAGAGNGQFTAHPEEVIATASHANWALLNLDINNDGLTDRVGVHLQANTLTTKPILANAAGGHTMLSAQSHALGTAPSSGWRLMPGDINHDGRVDLLVYGTTHNASFLHSGVSLRPLLLRGDGQYSVGALSTTGWFQFVSFGGGASMGASSRQLTLRFVSDRNDSSSHLLVIDDVAHEYSDSGGENFFTQRTSTYQGFTNLDGPKVLRGVAEGGLLSTISYGSLMTPGVYTKDTTATYPRVDLRYPMRVVSSVSRSNGLGSQNATAYSYGGLKAEHASDQHPGSGRGMLGFRWMKSTEAATGIAVTTEVSQAWPTMGQVIKSETHRAGSGNGGLLKQTTNSYGCYQSAAAVGAAQPSGATASCGTWAVGKVYFPFMSSSMEDSWDLNGALMPRITTTHTLDGYADQASAVRQFGDPTQVQVDIHHSGVLKHRKVTVNEYHPAKTGGTDWQLGRLKKATVTSTQY